MAKIHYRMPVILVPGQFQMWLEDGDRDVLRPCDDYVLAAHPVDAKVGDVRNNGPELMEPIS